MPDTSFYITCNTWNVCVGFL